MLFRKKSWHKETKIQNHSKINIQKLLLLILMFFAFAHANEGPIGVKAVVSEKNIVAGDIIELKIRAIGSRAVFPTIKKIDGIKVLKQFERVTSMHTYSHGVLKRERTSLIVSFSPQRDMIIPSYEVEIEGKRYNTNPIKLKVKNTSTSNKNSNIFSLKLKSNKRSVMVGEAFLVTATISLQKGLYISNKAQYIRPAFQGFFVEQLGKGKSYYEDAYQITEFRYILTPHTKGNYTLGPAQAKIGLQNKGKKDTLNVGLGRKWFNKASNTLELEVYPQKQNSDLVGNFKLDVTIDTQETKANNPVKLTVKLEGEGNLVHFDLENYEIDDVTVYSKDTKLDIKVLGDKIHSSYSKQFIFISEKNFTIPEYLFSIFDPKEGKLTELKIQTYDIKIKSSKASTTTKNTSLPVVESNKITLTKKIETLFMDWWVLVLAFALGGIFFYLLRYLPKHERKTYKESEALKILYGHISKDPEVEEMVRKLYARKNGDRSVKINKKRLKELVERFR